MNLSKLWDWIDIGILIGILVWCVFKAFAVNFMLGSIVLVTSLYLAVAEIIEYRKTKHTITQNTKKVWKEDKWRVLRFVFAWLAFSIYLALHLTVLP